jgi:hypothetical protein
VTDTPAAQLDDAAAEMALGARDGTSTTEAYENAVRGAWEAATRPWPAEAAFPGLRAEVQMVAQLDPSAVEAWVLRPGQAAHLSPVEGR